MLNLKHTFLAVLALSHGIAAVPDLRPEPTPDHLSLPDGTNGWTPKPTDGPRRGLRARAQGQMHMNELFGRQDDSNDNTCGWYDANPASPIVCGGGTSSGCAYLPGTPANFWCCAYSNGAPDYTQCAYVSACRTAGAIGNVNTGLGVLKSGETILCPEVNPACVTTILSGPQGTVYSQFGCGQTGSTLFAAQTTTRAPVTFTESVTIVAASRVPTTVQVTTLVTVDNSQTEESTVVTSSSGESTSAVSSEGDPSATSSQANSTSEPTQGGSKPNVGAIAGGTVGGVAALAAIAAVVGFLVVRKRRQRAHPMREVSNMQYNSSM